jgi:hypothetical protein
MCNICFFLTVILVTSLVGCQALGCDLVFLVCSYANLHIDVIKNLLEAPRSLSHSDNSEESSYGRSDYGHVVDVFKKNVRIFFIVCYLPSRFNKGI